MPPTPPAGHSGPVGHVGRVGRAGATGPTRRRLDSLTGLRFPAALAVFAYHTGIHSNPGRAHDVASAIGGRGYVGVSFFFVLSGFVLTWSHRDGDRPRAFYRRRFARIAPAYWLCLAGAVLLDLAAGHVAVLHRALPSVVALQAWFPSNKVHFAANGPGWSISAEMFFYALFPLLVVVAARARGRWLLLTAVVVLTVVPALVLQPSDTEATGIGVWIVYVLPVTRLGDFLVGMLVAKLLRDGRRSPVPLPAALVLAVGVYWLTAYLPVWTTVTIAMVVPFALVVAAAAQADLEGTTTVWASRPLRRLGEWSFAFYLVQSLVLVVQHQGVKSLHLHPAAEWVTYALALAVSLVAAAIIHTFVESPLERRLRQAPPRATELGVAT